MGPISKGLLIILLLFEPVEDAEERPRRRDIVDDGEDDEEDEFVDENDALVVLLNDLFDNSLRNPWSSRFGDDSDFFRGLDCGSCF